MLGLGVESFVERNNHARPWIRIPLGHVLLRLRRSHSLVHLILPLDLEKAHLHQRVLALRILILLLFLEYQIV